MCGRPGVYKDLAVAGYLHGCGRSDIGFVIDCSIGGKTVGFIMIPLAFLIQFW